jgi:cytochrome bd-type quinol oxidase subunit 2
MNAREPSRNAGKAPPSRILLALVALQLTLMLAFLVLTFTMPGPTDLNAQTVVLQTAARLVPILVGASCVWSIATSQRRAAAADAVVHAFALAALCFVLVLFNVMLTWVQGYELDQLLGIVQVGISLGIVLQALILWNAVPRVAHRGTEVGA